MKTFLVFASAAGRTIAIRMESVDYLEEIPGNVSVHLGSGENIDVAGNLGSVLRYIELDGACSQTDING